MPIARRRRKPRRPDAQRRCEPSTNAPLAQRNPCDIQAERMAQAPRRQFKPASGAVAWSRELDLVVLIDIEDNIPSRWKTSSPRWTPEQRSPCRNDCRGQTLARTREYNISTDPSEVIDRRRIPRPEVGQSPRMAELVRDPATAHTP